MQPEKCIIFQYAETTCVIKYFVFNIVYNVGLYFSFLFCIHKKMLGYIYIFYRNAWFQLDGSFYWVIFNIFTQVLGHFNAGLYFYLAAGLSLSPVKLLNAAAENTGFLSSQEEAVLSTAAANLVHSFREIKVCIHFIPFIKSLMWCKLYYFTQCNIRTRCQLHQRRSSFCASLCLALHKLILYL